MFYVVFCTERNLEDHELVSQVYKGWTSSAENRFHIRRDLRKYEFFTDPTVSP